MTEEQIKEKICKLTGDEIIDLHKRTKERLESYGLKWPIFLGNYVGDSTGLVLDDPQRVDESMAIVVKTNAEDLLSIAVVRPRVFVEHEDFEDVIIAILNKQAEELEKLADKYGRKTQAYLDELEHASDIVAVLENKQKERLLSILVRNVDNVFRNTKISLPVKKDREIDFAFMEGFISQLEACRLSQLEACRLSQLEAYLLVTGLKNYTLTPAEEQALTDFQNGKVKWGEFNLENLYGKSTRGKRLKSADRINGDLPFVTAGEAETGVSAFIGNDVEIFAANTTTIDMFGSAKYRNYKYGGDDHIAVVHTEKINKYAAIFVTTAIHKSSYTGKFSYSRNFYAKDADELNIYLPTINNIPDYPMMEILISAVQKLVIKDVVEYADRKIEATKKIINK